MKGNQKELPFLKEVDNGCQIAVQAVPQASKTAIVGIHNNALKVKLAAPPVDGAANQELLTYFKKLFKLPKQNILLLKGQSSRSKLIEISGISKEAILKILEPLL